MEGQFSPSFFLPEICCSQIVSLIVILQKLGLLQPSSRGFLSLMKLFFTVFGWSLFPLEFPFGEAEIARGFHNPSQWLMFPDPLLESSESVSTFALLALLEATSLKITFFTCTWAYSNSSLGSRNGISLKKIVLFRIIFIVVLIISIVVVVVALASLLEITLWLVRGFMPLRSLFWFCVGAFPKGSVYTRRIFNHSASKQLFGLFVYFSSLGYLFPEFQRDLKLTFNRGTSPSSFRLLFPMFLFISFSFSALIATRTRWVTAW